MQSSATQLFIYQNRFSSHQAVQQSESILASAQSPYPYFKFHPREFLTALLICYSIAAVD